MPKNGRNSRKKSRTDWDRIRRMCDAEIDYSDIPPLPANFFRDAVFWPGPKQQITLRLDRDVLAFFRKTGKGYQSNINAVLRKYMEAQKRRAG